jgi:hypothetical protein
MTMWNYVMAITNHKGEHWVTHIAATSVASAKRHAFKTCIGAVKARCIARKSTAHW